MCRTLGAVWPGSQFNQNFSARAHDRILKVARVLADLDDSDAIAGNDVLEAINCRKLDPALWSRLSRTTRNCWGN